MRIDLVYDVFTHLIGTVLVDWRRDHEVDFGRSWEAEEVLDELEVVGDECVLLPLVILTIVLAKHNHHLVRSRFKCILQPLLVPYRLIPALHHGAARCPKVLNNELTGHSCIEKHSLQLRRVRVGARVRGAETLRDRIT